MLAAHDRKLMSEESSLLGICLVLVPISQHHQQSLGCSSPFNFVVQGSGGVRSLISVKMVNKLDYLTDYQNSCCSLIRKFQKPEFWIGQKSLNMSLMDFCMFSGRRLFPCGVTPPTLHFPVNSFSLYYCSWVIDFQDFHIFQTWCSLIWTSFVI